MLLDGLERARGLARRLGRHHLRRQLAAQHRAFHAAQELLAGPVAAHGQVGDGRLLAGAVLVPARNGRVHAAGHLHHGELLQARLPLWGLLHGARPLLVRGDLQREQPAQLAHGRIDDFLVRLLDPVHVAAGQRGAGREDQLEHALLLVVVLLAGGGHVRVHREQWRAREAQVVHALQLLVEPHVQVDHGDALQLIELVEVGHGLPLLGDHPADNVHGHGRHVLVRLHLGAVAHEQVLDGAVLVQHELFEGLLHHQRAAVLLDALGHGRTEPVGLVAVQEGHLQAVVLVQEAVHGGEHHGHGQLVWVDEVQGLGHGDEHLLVNPLGHAVLTHEVQHAELVLGVNEILAFNEHGQKRGGCLQLFAQCEHFLVHEDGQAKVEGGRNPRDKVKGGELSRKLLHGKNHLVNLPLKAVMDAQFREEVHHVGIGTEEDMEASLNPVSIFVFPGRNFPAQNVTGFIHSCLVSRVGEVLGTREAGQPAADNCNLLLGVSCGLQVGLKTIGKSSAFPVVIGVLNVRLRIISHN
mmetsp:Transcript_55422/g.80978  ORF Transcript_55422/g.80978 Transcript_55422/m.80978 type:complete len:524 (-) Transcript_55422:216-1787(-)